MIDKAVSSIGHCLALILIATPSLRFIDCPAIVFAPQTNVWFVRHESDPAHATEPPGLELKKRGRKTHDICYGDGDAEMDRSRKRDHLRSDEREDSEDSRLTVRHQNDDTIMKTYEILLLAKSEIAALEAGM